MSKRPLSGDQAYTLFLSDAPTPLFTWVALNKGLVDADYLIAVICAYRGMVERCQDGRYAGKVRLSCR